MVEVNRNIHVNIEAIKTIVSKCALEVPGVHSLRGSIYQQIVTLGSSTETRGIEILPGEDDESKRVEIHIAVHSGHPIPTVAENLQRTIKEKVENMTGIEVVQVNVYVDEIKDDSSTEKQTANEESETENEK